MRALVIKAKAFYWGHELWDQTTLWNLSTIKTEQNEVHVPAANDGHLCALITFKFSGKITHTPGILTPGDFLPDRSGGHVDPRWKSPNVVVDCEFGWQSPNVVVSVSLVWKPPDVMARVSFWFPCLCLDIVQIDITPLICSFHISIWGAWCIVWVILAHQILTVATWLVVCETWNSIAVPRSIWLRNNCRRAFAPFAQVYLMCLLFVKNLPILGKVD